MQKKDRRARANASDLRARPFVEGVALVFMDKFRRRGYSERSEEPSSRQAPASDRKEAQ